MKLLSTWTGVLVVILLAVAMAGLAVYQYANLQKPTALISAVVLALVAMLLSRRVVRNGKRKG
jgi:membrane protein implicated in regulation of membrane protease activity